MRLSLPLYFSVLKSLFPQYAVESQIRLKGYDPKTSLITVKPKPVSKHVKCEVRMHKRVRLGLKLNLV